MRLKKEDVYIDLKGKSKEELTDLYNFLKSIGERQHRGSLKGFLGNYKNYEVYNFNTTWTLGWYVNSKNKTEVTIEQLKEIIKPDLQTKLENAKKEVERIEKLIQEENKPKVGDWGRFWDGGSNNKIISMLINIYDDPYDRYETEIGYTFEFFEKITNPELIKLLENESK